MNLKKTWLSYLLWFVFAVAAVLISYNVLGDVLQEFYAMLSSYAPEFTFAIDLGGKVLTIAAVILLVVVLQYLCGRVKTPVVPKWLGIIGHILVCAGIVAAFCVLRYAPFMHALYFKAYSSEPSLQAQFFFTLSKVGALEENVSALGTVSVLEQGYLAVLHTLFLFFGNKIEVLYWLQLIAQSLTLVMLMFIGKAMQKGIFAWTPALLYAVAPTFFYSASDVGITNFWTLAAVFLLLVICLLEKAWKKKQITYLVIVFAQLIVAGLLFWSKMNVLIHGKAPFVSGGVTPGAENVLNWELLAWTAFFIIYSVTFFMDEQDGKVLLIIPFVGFSFLFAWLSVFEYEASYYVMTLVLLNLGFMISESMRTIFKLNPTVLTEKNKKIKASEEEKSDSEAYEWEEMKEVMHSTDGIEIREEEAERVELAFVEMEVEEKKDEEKPSVVIDKKAPIENVLPMPKKHKPKVLDYAFEPTEDMMHYDIEIENDEYDY